MEWQSLNALREKFLSFYESKGHLRLGSFPLIPKDDPSLLLINAGMAPLKKYFTGEVTPPRKRVTTCQKCIRTPDIERVGKTARHGTYFEMLGNFSFGDYFKNEATAWAWEFCTKVLEMPADRLWITIYEDDDEAFKIWTEKVGVDPSHIARMGKEDNFWELSNGPCGPCSEIYFDRGEKYGCGKPGCTVGCDCDRYVEFWNLVFTQFDSDGKGNYTPLAHPNIDTGMGLERLACIMQGVDNIFEVDTIKNIMKQLSVKAGVEYKKDKKLDISLRVITDHVRSTTMMLGDGVMPSNEGRGYVLRRLLRRAARHGRLLGIKGPFLYELCDAVIDEYRTAYPELVEKQEVIKKIILVEEESFGKTIDQGLNLLNQLMQGDIKELSGADAFKLYDTYGFPLDLTKDILEEKGILVNEEEFNALMEQQKKRARDSRKNSNIEGWKEAGDFLDGVPATEFVGYENDVFEGTVTAENGDNIVLDKTPFYAESGGQVADTGTIECENGIFEVANVTKTPAGVFVHSGKYISGKFNKGDKVVAKIDITRRDAIRRNHTAAHLLQAALRKTLGNHVEQAGQYVDQNAVRFDFTHFSALTSQELENVQNLVNNAILSAVDVVTEVLPIAEAKKRGAMALFGEKYGDTVRTVTAGEFSVELCGGTHVANTANIGLFKIISESSVASGVRRIEAVTGLNLLNLLEKYEYQVKASAAEIKAPNIFELYDKVRALNKELKQKEKDIAALESKIALSQVDNLVSGATDIKSFKLITKKLSVDSSAARSIAEAVKEKYANAVIVLAAAGGDKLSFVCACGKDAVKNGANAGKIVSAVAQMCGGNGGGKPDIAMAGGKDINAVDKALASVKSILEA